MICMSRSVSSDVSSEDISVLKRSVNSSNEFRSAGEGRRAWNPPSGAFMVSRRRFAPNVLHELDRKRGRLSGWGKYLVTMTKEVTLVKLMTMLIVAASIACRRALIDSIMPLPGERPRSKGIRRSKRKLKRIEVLGSGPGFCRLNHTGLTRRRRTREERFGSLEVVGAATLV